MRPEHAEADEDESDYDESERARLARGQRQVEEAQALGQRAEEDRTDDDASVARETAEDQNGVAEEGEARIELAWVEIGDVHGEEEPGDRRQRRCDAEGLQLEGENVLAERRRSVLVFADRLEHASPGAELKRPERGEAEEQRGPHRDQQRNLRRLAEADRGELLRGPGLEGAPLRVVADDALVAAGEGGVLKDIAHDLGEGDGDDAEIVGAQPQAWAGRPARRPRRR